MPTATKTMAQRSRPCPNTSKNAPPATSPTRRACSSLDESSVREIGHWLGANAGTYKRVSEMPPQDRITKSAWFLRKHRDGEVPAGVWARASVGSASNCVACHGGAAQGNFNERDIKIPK